METNIIIICLFCFIRQLLFVFLINQKSKNYTRISDAKLNNYDLTFYLNAFKFNIPTVLVTHISYFYESNSIIYDITTFILMSFYFEIVFDFFYYWTHRLCHHKYFYFMHKTHHKHTNDISSISIYNMDILEMCITGSLSLFLTSYIVPLSSLQYFTCLTYLNIIDFEYQ